MIGRAKELERLFCRGVVRNNASFFPGTRLDLCNSFGRREQVRVWSGSPKDFHCVTVVFFAEFKSKSLEKSFFE